MAEEPKTNNMAYKMKGSPMLRNFGIGEKESPHKFVWAAVLPYVYTAAASAAVAGGTAAISASAKKKEARRKASEKKKQEALDASAEGISEDIGGKTDLLKS